MTPLRIDINCDMGESFGPWRMGADEQVMPHITSANIACGAHAGDPSVMRRTVRLARAAGLRVAAEGFADRAYEPDGSLTPRSRPGAVIHDPEAVVARAVRMAGERVVLTAAGREVPLRVDTICVHGDTPGAHELTKRIREALQAAGATVAPIGGWL